MNITENQQLLLRDALVSRIKSDIVRMQLLKLSGKEASLDNCISLASAIELSSDVLEFSKLTIYLKPHSLLRLQTAPLQLLKQVRPNPVKATAVQRTLKSVIFVDCAIIPGGIVQRERMSVIYARRKGIELRSAENSYRLRHIQCCLLLIPFN